MIKQRDHFPLVVSFIISKVYNEGITTKEEKNAFCKFIGRENSGLLQSELVTGSQVLCLYGDDNGDIGSIRLDRIDKYYDEIPASQKKIILDFEKEKHKYMKKDKYIEFCKVYRKHKRKETIKLLNITDKEFMNFYQRLYKNA